MVTDAQSQHQVLSGLDNMAAKHLTAAAYLTFCNLGVIEYPLAALDHFNAGNHFTEWSLTSPHCFYQGQITSKGLPDGRGTRIKNGGLQIGHIKLGKAHGGFIKIRQEGTLQIGVYKNDRADGHWTVIKPDQKKFSLYYENGVLI